MTLEHRSSLKKKVRKVYIILSGSRGRSEYTRTIFSSERKARKYCDFWNSKPDPGMGWRNHFSFREVVLNEEEK